MNKSTETASCSLTIFADWRDPENYPHGDQRLPIWWAWQFLRRNEQYQKDYAELMSLPGDERYTQDLEYAKRWGIIIMVDPMKADAFVSPLPGNSGLPRPIHREDKPHGLHEAGLMFDLRFPLDRQIEYAKQWLMLQRESWRRLHAARGSDPREAKKTGRRITNMPVYLRAFDGWMAGATALEIAQKIGNLGSCEDSDDSGPRKVRKYIQTAKKISKDGYRELLHWA